MKKIVRQVLVVLGYTAIIVVAGATINLLQGLSGQLSQDKTYPWPLRFFYSAEAAGFADVWTPVVVVAIIVGMAVKRGGWFAIVDTPAEWSQENREGRTVENVFAQVGLFGAFVGIAGLLLYAIGLVVAAAVAYFAHPH